MAFNHHEWYLKNKKRVLEARHRNYWTNRERECLARRNRYFRSRLRVLIHYSGKPPFCKCCREERIEFLSVDHTRGGGRKHRKEIRGGAGSFYRWLEKNNFPEGFTILCHNCNLSKGFYGYCAHWFP